MPPLLLTRCFLSCNAQIFREPVYRRYFAPLNSYSFLHSVFMLFLVIFLPLIIAYNSTSMPPSMDKLPYALLMLGYISTCRLLVEGEHCVRAA